MNFFVIGFLIMQAARLACGTCVFESDFGFALNCNFKKSGLFRVRNLGGLKAHFGLGFSVGDELGFAESLGNLEGGRRRAISYKNGPPPNLVGVLPATQQTVPSQHPIPEKRITSRSTGALPQQAPPMKRQLPIAPPPPPPAPASSVASAAPPMQVVVPVPLMTEARPLPLGVPAFRPIPKKKVTAPVYAPGQTQTAQRRAHEAASVDTTNPRVSVNNKLVESYSQPVHSNRTFHVTNPMVSQPMAVPAFQAMPSSVSRVTNVFGNHENTATDRMDIPSMAPAESPNYLQFEEPKFDLKGVSVNELASAANVSIETIKHAIYVREQQLKAEHRAMLASKLREEFIRTSTSTSSTTTTTTPQPFTYLAPIATVQNNKIESIDSKVNKVMNAPKEYYPVGYDKNFDDNFKSKVDLPPTTFNCNNQKHFPGLYADTDLGCMVFHVCALTDDGLVRKSFLCPENTLFDQTILKCNWWFYVDCNASKSVYDSNIPISKSYQLMKSLTYFSKFTKGGAGGGGSADDATAADDDGLDMQTLKESVESAARKLSVDTPDMADDELINDAATGKIALADNAAPSTQSSSTTEAQQLDT